MRWAGGALAAIAVLGAGCSNQIVTRAPIVPSLTATTLIPSGPPPSPLPSRADLITQALAQTEVSATDIAHAPINVLRTKALANIKTKLNALNGGIAALGTISHLSAAGSALEKDELNGSIEGLTALQAQITNETDIGLMRTEASHLVDYADVGTIIVPKVILLQNADTVLRTTDSLNTQIGQLQTRINTAAAKGKATGGAVAALGTVRSDTAQAASTASGVMTSVPLLSATQTDQITPDNNTVLAARAAAASAQSAVGTVGTALQAVGA